MNSDFLQNLKANFTNFDVQKKGYLTYKEYKLMSLSYFIKPIPKKEIGDCIVFQDIQKYLEKNIGVSEDYEYDQAIELFNELSIDKVINFESLKKICVKIVIGLNENEICEMVSAFEINNTIDFETFMKIYKFCF